MFAPNHFLQPLLLLTIVYISAAVLAQFSSSFAGPYDVILKQIGDCEKQGAKKIVIYSNKIRKYNRTAYTYSTNVTLSLTFSDNIKLVAAVAVFGNGGWKQNYFREELGGACTSITRILPQLTKEMMRNVGITSCPIPPGNYTANDLGLNVDLNWPSLPYNKYRLDASFYNKGKLVGCKRFFADIVPKAKN